MADSPFKNRLEAGQALACKLRESQLPDNAVALGLPRGGVPIAWEVARALRLELDVLNLRKLGVPGHSELAMGAVAEDGTRYLNASLVRRLGITEAQIQEVEAREKAVLASRARLFRGARSPVDVNRRAVILMDDGVATGATMELAVQVLKARGAATITVAVPVGPPGTADRFSRLADRGICLLEPARFNSVGQWYEDFRQVTEDEVIDALTALPTRIRQADQPQRP